MKPSFIEVGLLSMAVAWFAVPGRVVFDPVIVRILDLGLLFLAGWVLGAQGKATNHLTKAKRCALMGARPRGK